MGPKIVTLLMVTCFLIASKYDEIDDQLVFINDVQKYFNRAGLANCPTWTEIVETERMLMNFLGWDLGFVLPVHFLEIFLANGILFESEEITSNFKTKETAKKIADKCFQILDDMVR